MTGIHINQCVIEVGGLNNATALLDMVQHFNTEHPKEKVISMQHSVCPLSAEGTTTHLLYTLHVLYTD